MSKVVDIQTYKGYSKESISVEFVEESYEQLKQTLSPEEYSDLVRRTIPLVEFNTKELLDMFSECLEDLPVIDGYVDQAFIRDLIERLGELKKKV